MKDKLKFALLSAGESPMNLASKVDIIAEALMEFDDSVTLLWENASPTSAFDEQTIQVNLENYKFALIICDDWADSNRYISTIATVGKTCVITLASVDGGRVCNQNRVAVVRNNNIYFEKARKSYPDKDSEQLTNVLIPIKVYGIK